MHCTVCFNNKLSHIYKLSSLVVGIQIKEKEVIHFNGEKDVLLESVIFFRSYAYEAQVTLTLVSLWLQELNSNF